MRHNETLHALIRAVENGDDTAPFALADCLMELGEDDLATYLLAMKEPAKVAEVYRWADAWRRVDMQSVRAFTVRGRYGWRYFASIDLRQELRRHGVKRYCVVAHCNKSYSMIKVHSCHPSLTMTPPTVLPRMVEFLDKFFSQLERPDGDGPAYTISTYVGLPRSS